MDGDHIGNVNTVVYGHNFISCRTIYNVIDSKIRDEFETKGVSI